MLGLFGVGINFKPLLRATFSVFVSLYDDRFLINLSCIFLFYIFRAFVSTFDFLLPFSCFVFFSFFGVCVKFPCFFLVLFLFGA